MNRLKKRIVADVLGVRCWMLGVGCWMLGAVPVWSQTLDECQQAARQNYPTIRRLELAVEDGRQQVAILQKGWLPRLQAQLQATWQSDVTAFPEQLQGVYRQMGINMEGLKKQQYRAGLDLEQTVLDGGAISAQQRVARRQAAVKGGQVEVELYALESRVTALYFGLLLLDQQLQLVGDAEQLLTASEQQLASMQAHGLAAMSDYLSVKAERLAKVQLLADLEEQRRSVGRQLSVLCGMPVDHPVKPALPPAAHQSVATGRPELRLIEARWQLSEAKERQLDAALKPRLSLFAQGFYGYPGYNLFEDMMHRSSSLNAMVGARLSWSIGALYTRKGDKARLALERSELGSERETFLLNNRLEQVRHDDNMSRYSRLMASDDEIISLRVAVREAAEQKLKHGIVNTVELLREVNAEHAARLNRSVHELELLREAYEKKHTTNE